MLCYVSAFLFFFFFKQKTASEMRISDWSSDVCSSDLHFGALFRLRRALHRTLCLRRQIPVLPHFIRTSSCRRDPMGLHLSVIGPQLHFVDLARRRERHRVEPYDRVGKPPRRHVFAQRREQVVVADGRVVRLDQQNMPLARSEAHTSELQSLMLISYAVLFLTKKITMFANPVRF